MTHEGALLLAADYSRRFFGDLREYIAGLRQ